MQTKEEREKLIEAWFVESFHREPIATNTEHYNHVRRSVDDLKARLAKED